MKLKAVSGIMLTLLLIGMLTFAFNVQPAKTQPTTPFIYVDPPISAKDVTAIDQEFTVSIRIAQVQFLQSWRFDLEWNSSLLEILNDPETSLIEGVSEGPFLNKEGEFQTTWAQKEYYIDGSIYKVSTTCALKGVAVANLPSGSGTLATVTFKVKAEGECPLHFNFTRLLRPTSEVDPILIEIPHSAEDGYFKYPLPVLYIEPSSIMDAGLDPGSNFTINIKVSQITDLYAWNLTLYWNPAVLEAKNVTEGPFLKSTGTTVFSPPEINQTVGYLNASCTLVDLVPGANGTGTISNITFEVKAKGQSRISLTLTRPPLPDLDKSLLVDGKKAPIYHATESSVFTNLVRDIAVTKIEVSSTQVKGGDFITVNVTVKNEGFKNETSIDVSVTTPSPPSPSYNIIGTTTIPGLTTDQETTLSFIWDTQNLDKGEYTIRAESSTVPEEIDIEDNVLNMDGTVKVTADAFMQIFEVVWESQVFNVVIESPSTVSDFAFSQSHKLISFNVNGSSGITSFCNVTIPKDLLWVEDGWTVYVGDDEVIPTVASGDNCTYLYFTYSHSIKTVEIKGTGVIPEFPTWTSMLLILIILTVVIAIHKRRLPKILIH